MNLYLHLQNCKMWKITIFCWYTFLTLASPSAHIFPNEASPCCKMPTLEQERLFPLSTSASQICEAGLGKPSTTEEWPSLCGHTLCLCKTGPCPHSWLQNPFTAPCGKLWSLFSQWKLLPTARLQTVVKHSKIKAGSEDWLTPASAGAQGRILFTLCQPHAFVTDGQHCLCDCWGCREDAK